MKEIVERLQENRNIERAKQILESNGYKVTKKMNESRRAKRLKESASEPERYGDVQSTQKYLADYNSFISPENIKNYYGDDPEYHEEVRDFVKKISQIIKENPEMTHVYVDASVYDNVNTEEIYRNGSCKILKVKVYINEDDADNGVETPAYIWSTDWRFGVWDLFI